MLMKTFVTCFYALFLPLCAYSQELESYPLNLEVIRIINYADLLRNVVTRDCNQKIELVDNVLCAKITFIPKDLIENTALPYFNHYVSEESAKSIIQFYGTSEGKEINEKFIYGIGHNSDPDLSQKQFNQLSEFTNSNAGQELDRLAKDKNISLEILQVLAGWTPSIAVDVTSVYKNNCKTRKQTKIRVFHSMYSDEETANLAYAKIIKQSKSNILHGLKLEAKKNTIDPASKQNSGDLGFVPGDSFDQNFDDAVFSLPLKKLSKPLQSEYGWHLVWVDAAKDVDTDLPCLQYP